MTFRDLLRAHLLSLPRMAGRWRAARRGNIAMMTALMMAPIVGMMGLALDYGHLILVKSRLDQAALAGASAAANAARNVVQTGQGRENDTYNQENFNTKAIEDGKTIGKNIFQAQFGSTAPTVDVAVERVSNTFTAKVNYTSTLETYFAKYFNVTVFTIKGQQSMIVGISDTPAQSAPVGSTLDEKWIGSYAVSNDPTKPVMNDWYSGTPGSVSPLNPSDGGLRNGARENLPSAFIQVGGSLIDTSVNPAVSKPVAPIISKKVYLPVGNYELRYWYKSTLIYPDYEPVYICGSVEGEMHWATAIATRSLASSKGSPTTNANGAQSARAGAYLVPILTNPQLATTPPAAGRMKSDGTVSGSNDFPQPPELPYIAPTRTNSGNIRADNSQNRLDICAYSSRWIQRSVSLSVTEPGYFWLSFVAEPPTKTSTTASGRTTVTPNTVNGFYLGRVQLCDVKCSETLNTNWAWTKGTDLYTADFTSGAPDSAFDANGSGTFGASANYEKTTNWTVRVFGSLRGNPIDSDPRFPLYKYLRSNKPITPDTPSSIITSNRSSAYLYRGLLLTAGTYRATFTIGAGSSTNGYCSITPAMGPVINSNCTCFVGSPNPNIAHGDQIAVTGLTVDLDATTNNTVAGYYSRPYTGAVASSESDEDTGTADSANARGNLMGYCYNSSNPKTFTYCFLVPRTQYYGVNFRTAGPQLDTAPDSLRNSPYPELRANPPDLTLGSGGARLYSLKIDVLTQGIKNSNNLDFPDYATACDKSLRGNATPSLTNVMAAGTPVWPGVPVDRSAYSNPPIRLTVTPPFQ